MPDLIIGTAGHIDHGKTVLVRALTGQDTDRLPEEKKRGISIDLGFALLRLPDGTTASVVDVPGHERFVRNMVAGSYGIDLALVVVAADEGVMPQTVEHLDILDLLGIDHGVVAITKVDLADEELLEMVAMEIQDALRGRRLEGTPLVPVSAETGRGVPDVANALSEEARRIRDRGLPFRIAGPPRLPVDRAFTVPGFGTVATGTLRGDALEVGMELEWIPGGGRTRIRSLQVHGGSVERAEPGQRVAANLPDATPEDLPRGTWVAEPGYFASHRVLATSIRVLASAPPLEEGDIVALHIGTAEVSSRVSVLDGDRIASGEEGFARLHPRDGVPAAFGDGFIVRRPAPIGTVAGGRVLDVRGYRYRRGRPGTRALLERRAGVDRRDIVLAALEGAPAFRFPPRRRDLVEDLSWDGPGLDEILSELFARGDVVTPGDIEEVILTTSGWAAFADLVADRLKRNEERHPLAAGLRGEAIRNALYPRSEPRTFVRLLDALVDEGHIDSRDGRFVSRGYEPRPDVAARAAAEALLEESRDRGFAPLSIQEAIQWLPGDTGRPLIEYLIARGDLVRVGDYLVEGNQWDSLHSRVATWFAEEESLTVSQLRTLVGTTRKYAVPLAEALDDAKITLRRGDYRYPGSALRQGEGR